MSKTKNQTKKKTINNFNTPQRPIMREEPNKEDSIENSKYIYELVNGWIENADNKVSVSCAVFTGVFGVLTFLAENSIKVPDNPTINVFWHKLYIGSLILSVVIMLIAVFFYAKAIYPNLNSNDKNKKKREKKYPIYFGDICSLDYEQYETLMQTGTIQDFKEELMRDSWYNSRICLTKMKRYRTGVKFSLIAIIFASFSLICHYLIYK